MRVAIACLAVLGLVGCGDGTEAEKKAGSPLEGIPEFKGTGDVEATPAPRATVVPVVTATPVVTAAPTVQPTVAPAPVVTASPVPEEYRLKCSASWEGTLDQAIGPVRLVHEYETTMVGAIEVGPWKPYRICANKVGDPERCGSYNGLRELANGWTHDDQCPSASGSVSYAYFLPPRNLGAALRTDRPNEVAPINVTPTCTRVTAENPGWWPQG